MSNDAQEWRQDVPGNGGEAFEVATTDDDFPEETSVDRISLMLGGSLNDERAIIKLYRRDAKGKLEWCGDYKPPEFEEGGFEMIRREYGPGQYHVRVYGPGPSNRQVVRTHTDITIAARASDLTRPESVASGFPEMLRIMQEQNNAIMKALTDRPQIDPMQSMKETLTLASLFKEAFGAGGNSGNGIGDVVKAIRELREVSDEINPKAKDDSEPSLMGMLPQMLELVKTVASKQGQETAEIPLIAAPPRIAAHVAAPIPQPVTEAGEMPAIETPAQSEPETDPMNAFQIAKLRMVLTTLLAMAAKPDTVSTAADLIDAELPDEMLEMMEQDNWWSELVKYSALLGVDVAPHQVWFNAVRTELMTDQPDSPAA